MVQRIAEAILCRFGVMLLAMMRSTQYGSTHCQKGVIQLPRVH
jgi:hypothetical protein